MVALEICGLQNSFRLWGVKPPVAKNKIRCPWRSSSSSKNLFFHSSTVRHLRCSASTSWQSGKDANAPEAKTPNCGAAVATSWARWGCDRKLKRTCACNVVSGCLAAATWVCWVWAWGWGWCALCWPAGCASGRVGRRCWVRLVGAQQHRR